MWKSPDGDPERTPGARALTAYVADLELEVDHLRKRGQFIRHHVRDCLRQIQQACRGAAPDAGAQAALAEVGQAAARLEGLLRDVQEPAGYHPAHDQVIAIAVRPLVEQVFRWQQRLTAAPDVALRLELESEHMEWFPARLRHILDNLLSNALKYRDPSKAEAWVHLALRVAPSAYELRLSDNGTGLARAECKSLLDALWRAAPARTAGLEVGLAVVKLLVEQSGGTLTADSGAGQGSTFVAVLPRYDVDDFLT
jgi:signal transduction histidine kinase